MPQWRAELPILLARQCHSGGLARQCHNGGVGGVVVLPTYSLNLR